jgi:hypothetical protein
MPASSETYVPAINRGIGIRKLLMKLLKFCTFSGSHSGIVENFKSSEILHVFTGK